MRLPAICDTDIDAAALAYTKECVRFIHTDSVRLFGCSWFTKEGGHHLTRRFLKQYALINQFTLDEIFTDAVAGWSHAHWALGELITEFQARGQQLLPQLAAYDIHAWRMQHPSNRGGRERADHVTRNIAAAVIMKAVVEHFGLKATKNKQSKRPARHRSAASLLAQALKEELPEGVFKPGERTLEAMWENFGPRLLRFAAGFRPPIPLPVPNFPPPNRPKLAPAPR
jgi:hypothetical protein